MRNAYAAQLMVTLVNEHRKCVNRALIDHIEVSSSIAYGDQDTRMQLTRHVIWNSRRLFWRRGEWALTN